MQRGERAFVECTYKGRRHGGWEQDRACEQPEEEA